MDMYHCINHKNSVKLYKYKSKVKDVEKMVIDVIELDLNVVNFEKQYESSRIRRAKEIFKNGDVTVKEVEKLEDEKFKVLAEVNGRYHNHYRVDLVLNKDTVKKYECTCEDYKNGYICKHILATSMEIIQPHQPSTKEGKKKLEDKKQKEREEKRRQYELQKAEEQRLFELELERRRKKYEYEAKYSEALDVLRYFKKINDIKHYDEKLETNINLKRIYEEAKQEKNEKNNMLPNLSTNVKLEPRIELNGTNEMDISFKIGETQMYIMKDIAEFCDAYEKGEMLQYGKNLKFIARKENFDRKSLPMLEFILDYGRMLKYNERMFDRYFYGSMFGIGKSLSVIDDKIDEFLEIVKDEVLTVTTDRVDKQEFTMTDEEIKVEANITRCLEDNNETNGTSGTNEDLAKNDNSKEYELSINIKGYDYIVTNKNIYIFYKSKIYKLDKNKNKNLENLLEIFNANESILIPGDKVEEFSKYVIPEVKDYLNNVQLAEDTAIQGLIVDKLASKMYLDLDEKDNIILELKFCYKDCEFNILDNNYDKYVKEKKIVRDVPKEREVLKRIFEDGFELSNSKKYFTLKNQDDTYEFLSEKITKYMNDFEVLVTDKFKNKKVRFTNISNVSIKLDNGLLELDISKVDIDLNEIKDVLKNYNIKKKYYKLKNGDYINLQQSEGLDFLNELSNNLEIKYDKINKGIIELPANRSIYLEQLLKQNNKINATKNDEFTKLINNVEDKDFSDNIQVEKDFEKILRDYQKTGYKWLKVLEHYKFGGILADDMGLGKTLQVIALIASELKKKKSKPSIVVCPSSLVLNWKAEIEKWCNKGIKVLVIKGDADSRKILINSYEKYNLIITSYDLLKRDVEEYQNKKFKYIIADEAQYIKNFATQNATALKSLEGETKLALTGTPIENSISELWSIFDFIMPGYLYSYNKFKKKFEMPILKDNDEEMLKRLKQLISPFILRRVKSQVLTELPEKNITIMNNEMTTEQEKLYLSYFAQTKKEVVQELRENGFEKSKFKILMLLTRLRQICCHPSLFISNYSGESGKLNQCMDIINEAISSGHKILLFSGYTSMFEIIEEKLKEGNIEYFKLTGTTPVDKRVEMVEQFNNDENIKIFLISLKAGGTGLNLTGADVVIHYDPWWNVSAENQATDRAYRIGQKNSVQVYKLITTNSIEEKINKLQEKKAKISEQLLSTEETFINKLSKEEIMELFE